MGHGPGTTVPEESDMMRRRNAINDSMKEEKKRPFWRYLLEALLVIALIIGINSWRTRDAVSGPAPMLSGNTLNGESYLLPRKPGEPLLVYFWASWCPVCKFQDGNIAIIDHGKIIENTDMKSLLATLDVETFVLDLREAISECPSV